MTLNSKQILRHYYRGGGLDGESSGAFASLGNGIKERISRFLDDSKPIVASFVDERNWTAVTDSRIIVMDNGKIVSAQHSQLLGAYPIMTKKEMYTPNIVVKIRVNSSSSGEIIAPLESGATAFGFWHMLVQLCSHEGNELKNFSE